MSQLKSVKSCSVPNCGRVYKCRGFCGGHYETWRKKNRDQIASTDPRWVNEDGTRMECFSSGCVEVVVTQGMCTKHYSQMHYASTRGSRVDLDKKRRPYKQPQRFCTFPECANPEFNPGVCAGHYYQLNRGEELRPLFQRFPCKANGCSKTYPIRKGSNGLCSNHRSFAKRFSLDAETVIAYYQNYVCGNPACVITKDLHMDHDHACCKGGGLKETSRSSCGSCVRGWLCRGCNFTLGHVKDSVPRLRGLITYLEESKNPDSSK